MIDTYFDLNFQILFAVQNLGSWLNFPMKFFTFLGNEEFYLLLMPAIYWCINARLGLQIGVILLLSNGVNTLMKIGFHRPRPYWLSDQVWIGGHLGDFSFPSGHAQIGISIWGFLAFTLRKGWAWIGAAAVIFLIGMSRIYLGVHFPIDIAAGWAVGALLLAAYIQLKKPVGTWLRKQSLGLQIVIIAGLIVLLLLAGFVLQQRLENWQIPVDWMERAGEDITSMGIVNLTTISGVFLGLGAGAAFLNSQGEFNTTGTITQKIIRYLVGLIGVAVLWAGLDALFPDGATLAALVWRFIRYTLVGLWISWGAPLVFWALKLAHRKNPTA
jgi:membrane-associated phospholipid phosphatase